MHSAVEPLREKLKNIKFINPKVPVVSNLTGSVISNAEEISENLVRQIIEPVLWSASIELLVNGATAYEIGAGATLKSILNRSYPSISVINIEA